MLSPVVCRWVLVALMSITVASSSPVNQSSREIGHQESIKALSQWKCGTPRPKLVYVAELLHQTKGIYNIGARYIPQALVVPQCSRDLGCCNVDGQSCQSQERETVRYEIYVRWSKSKKTEMTLDVEQDVSCVCR